MIQWAGFNWRILKDTGGSIRIPWLRTHLVMLHDVTLHLRNANRVARAEVASCEQIWQILTFGPFQGLRLAFYRRMRKDIHKCFHVNVIHLFIDVYWSVFLLLFGFIKSFWIRSTQPAQMCLKFVQPERRSESNNWIWNASFSGFERNEISAAYHAQMYLDPRKHMKAHEGEIQRWEC